MSTRYFIWGGIALVALLVAGVGAWLFSLPSVAGRTEAMPIAQNETNAMVAALKPPKRERPLVAVIGINDSTEITDYLVPTGILRRSDVADVVMLATGPGPVQLYPALAVEADVTVTEFDLRYPDGADYVVVPAMSRDDDPTVLRWLQDQASKGATIIGVCAGAKIVAATGLLEGRRATTHWYYLDEMLKRGATIRYVPDRRMVVDGAVVTTTGVTASIPMMLTLIEAIAGREKAEAVAKSLGVDQWDARHDSGAFTLTRRFAMTVLLNRLAFWRAEELSIRLDQGIDEVALALVADAWSRTYRSKVLTFSERNIATTSGIRIIPDHSDRIPNMLRLPTGKPATILDEALAQIAARYGANTSDIVAMQLEYPRDAMTKADEDTKSDMVPH